MGTYIVTDLGEHAIGDRHHSINDFIYSGTHCLTQEEFDKRL